MHDPDFVDECYVDKDLSLLKKLTLVIPTYNRNYYLSRCLWYHAHFPFGEIIVADSSPEEKKVVNRATAAKVREIFGANVRYLEYEPETDKYGGDIYRKWGDAVQHVKTEYSQIVTDKEYYVPTTFSQFIEYLDKYQDFSIIIGNQLLLQKTNDNKYFLTSERLIHNCEDYSSEKPADRYNIAMKHRGENNLLLALYKSKIHIDIYQAFLKTQISDLHFGEQYLAYIGYIYGKVKFFTDNEYDYCIRDVSGLWNKKHTGIDSSESSALKYSVISRDKRDVTYDQRFTLYRDAIMNVFIAKSISNMNNKDLIYDLEYNEKIKSKCATWIQIKNLVFHYIRYVYGYIRSIPMIGKCIEHLKIKILNGIPPRKCSKETQIIWTITNETDINRMSDSVCHFLFLQNDLK